MRGFGCGESGGSITREYRILMNSGVSFTSERTLIFRLGPPGKMLSLISKTNVVWCVPLCASVQIGEFYRSIFTRVNPSLTKVISETGKKERNCFKSAFNSFVLLLTHSWWLCGARNKYLRVATPAQHVLQVFIVFVFRDSNFCS